MGGKEYYIFKIPTQEALAMKLVTTAMAKSGANGFQALKLLLETFDGRAKQDIELTNTEPTKIIFENVSKK